MPEKKESEQKVSSWLDSQSPQRDAVALTVVVPAYNEQWRLPPTLLDIVDYLDSHKVSYEVLVVDDGSKDETASIVKKFERVRKEVRLIHLPTNRGKGHAVKLGVLNAQGERILFADADGATPFEEIERLMKAVDEGADIAIGSRALSSEETSIKTRWYRKYLGRIFNAVVNLVILPGIADTQCGFKLFTKDAAQKIFPKQHSNGFSFDVEILFIAGKKKFKITEVPINWTNVAGSKVNLIVDSTKMLIDVFRFRMWHRDL